MKYTLTKRNAIIDELYALRKAHGKVQSSTLDRSTADLDQQLKDLKQEYHQELKVERLTDDTMAEFHKYCNDHNFAAELSHY